MLAVATFLEQTRRSEGASSKQEEGNVKFILFSATFPKQARELAKNLSPKHVRLRVGRAGSSHENIKQPVIYVNVKFMLFAPSSPSRLGSWRRPISPKHVRLHVGRAGSSHENIKQPVIYVNVKFMLFAPSSPSRLGSWRRPISPKHVRLHVGRAGSSHENVKQPVFYVDPSLKKQALIDLVKPPPPTRTIIFVNSKCAGRKSTLS